MASKPVCRFFSTAAGCRYGSTCRFLHEHKNAASGNGPLTVEARGECAARPLDDLTRWKYRISKDNKRPVDPARVQRFFQDGQRLVEKDIATAQEAVMLLSSEGGLAIVRHMLERAPNIPVMFTLQFIDNDVVPLFRILHNATVQRSILLENAVATIYNIIFGPQGERAINLFSRLTNAIDDIDPDQCIAVMFVFMRTVEVNGSAMLNPEIKAIAKDLIQQVQQKTPSFDNFQAAEMQKYCRKLIDRFEFADLVAPLEIVEPVIGVKAHFQTVYREPGGRHDNDHTDYRNIKILPTFEEIKSAAPEYLPVINQPRPGVTREHALLDRQFRLLREDTIGQLRDAIRVSMDPQDPSQLATTSGLRTYTYASLHIHSIVFSNKHAFEILVSIQQPAAVLSHDSNWRKDWWERSRRLQPDSLICITTQDDRIIYCTVSTQGQPQSNRSKNNSQTAGTSDGIDPNINLYADDQCAYLTLKVVDDDLQSVEWLCQYVSQDVAQSASLVEFPGILLPAFQPILQALQEMGRNLDSPLLEVIARGPDAPITVPPPSYSMTGNFKYDLSSLTTDGSLLTFDPHHPVSTDAIEQRTALDHAQTEALVHGLSTSLALIQGPPGTGKSFTGVALIKSLLSVRDSARTGPVICVCFTNHALDQVLEHLHQDGVRQLIRMGAQSKSEVLSAVTLRAVAEQSEPTRAEKQEMWSLRKSIRSSEAALGSLLKELALAGTSSSLAEHLKTFHPEHHDQIFAEKVDKDGYQMVTYGKNDLLSRWLYPVGSDNIHTESSEHGRQERSMYQSNHLDRQNLYERWKNEIRSGLIETIAQEASDYFNVRKRLHQLRHEIDLRCLNDAHVVGVTTTGLARNLSLLRRLNAKILVCEEAGEVLEAHITTALLPSVEHVILIGDHQQLRPKIQKYELSHESPHGERYSLDISLFERLVGSDGRGAVFPFRKLDVQRRMHPSISNLIRSTLYPDMQDAANVQVYPEVSGMRKRLSWLDHTHYEDGGQSEMQTTSHVNKFEVKMVTCLVSHLVRQGAYEPKDIAVLTPYLGQLFKIKAALSSVTEVAMDERDLADAEQQGIELEEKGASRSLVFKTTLLKSLRAATVDNFQGEEAKVVIISLVRSNAENRCGFLKTSNRINVLLSRAKHGMYIIGNARTASQSPMWRTVQQLLKVNGNIGSTLGLLCNRHQEAIEVKDPDDFNALSPEGGCQRLCDQRLACGHKCPNKCHSRMLHNAVKCLEPCQRSLPGCDHACARKCGEQCTTACQVILTGEKINLRCEHDIVDPSCHQYQNPTEVDCREFVWKSIPGCGHTVKVKCCIDTSNPEYRCPEPCKAILDCGHFCTRRCGDCHFKLRMDLRSDVHKRCQRICGRRYDACSHTCEDICHGKTGCEPCQQECQVACAHSKCSRKCSDPCPPCAEEVCSSACPHSNCTMPCAAPCNWLPCQERCTEKLACGHQCPSLCGESCPTKDFCQTCAAEGVREQQVDYITNETYAGIDLDDDPCIFPMCGHIITRSSLDGYVGLARFYDIGADGVPKGLRVVQWDENMKIAVCPQCRGTLRNLNRYGRAVRQILLVESTKKFICWATRNYAILAEQLDINQEKSGGQTLERVAAADVGRALPIVLPGSAEEEVSIIRRSDPRFRKHTAHKSFKQILEFSRQVSVDEQPFQRVSDLIRHARRSGDIDHSGHEHVAHAIQNKEAMRAVSLLIRCHQVVLTDFMKRANFEPSQSLIDMKEPMTLSIELAEEARRRVLPVMELEAYLYFARYLAAENSFTNRQIEQLRAKSNQQDADILAEQVERKKQVARTAIAQAKAVHESAPGSTEHLAEEIPATERMVEDGKMDEIMRPEEWKQVMAAMRKEFGGTIGHWYYCVNGHPFSIGECGGAMRTAQCPECGALIGGQHHQTVEGVTRADDLVREVEQMELRDVRWAEFAM